MIFYSIKRQLTILDTWHFSCNIKRGEYKMHNKTSLFKVNQSRVNPLSEIYIRLQKKKKNIPRIAIIQHSPIRLKKSSPSQQLYPHSRELIRNIDHSNNRWSIFSTICNGVPFPTGMEITTFSPFANNARPPAAQRAREAWNGAFDAFKGVQLVLSRF